MTYFKNYTNRFFFIYGQTKDEFYTSDLKVKDLREILHSHLKINKYDRIAYYQGTEGLYCYDKKSFDLSFNKKMPDEQKKLHQKSSNKVLVGVLGRRISKVSEANNNKFDVNTQILSKKLQDEDIVNQFDFLLKEEKIQTAIIFSDFNDFLIHTKPEVIRNLTSKLNDWDGLSSLNKNIVIFIVPSGISLQQLKKNEFNLPHYAQLLSKMFESTDVDNIKITKQVFKITNPNKDEIRNLINYLRIGKNLQINWLNFDECIEILYKISKEKNLSLKNISAEIQELTAFSRQSILDLFGITQKKKGMEKLKELRGMEYLTGEIEKIIKYAKSKKVEKKEQSTKEVQRIIPLRKEQKNKVNLHISLIGNPGTGKTTVAQIISEVFKENNILEVGHIIKAKSSDLVGEYIGHTAVKTQEKIDQAMGGVLFIDEAYKLLKNDFGHEAIDTIVEAMTEREGEFSVIIAGYPNEINEFIKSNPGLSRRFANKIHLKDYEPDILIKIFKDKMLKDSFSFEEELEEIFPYFIENWFNARDEKTFGNAGEIVNLFEKMAKSAIFDERNIFIKQDVPEELQRHLKKQSNNSMEETLSKLNDIVGLESVKENIKRIIAGIKMNKLRNKDTKILAGHYIFKGNPGTGKTTVARIFGEILKELKVLKKGHFNEVTREDLVQGYVGQTAVKTKKVLESSLGGVLFIDEAYSLSNGGDNDFGKEAIDTIVPFMENNINNFTLIAAGYNEDMDKFLNTNTGLKSRFTNTIVFEDYSNEEMLKIFRKFSKGYVLAPGVEEKLITIFNRLKSIEKHFGNGRDARKLFDTIRTNMDVRLDSLDITDSEDNRLYRIELEDLMNC